MDDNTSSRTPKLLERIVRHLDDYIWAWEKHWDSYQSANDEIRRAVATDVSEFKTSAEWLAYVSFRVAKRPNIQAVPTLPSLLAGELNLKIEAELASLQTHDARLLQLWQSARTIADPEKCTGLNATIEQCKNFLADLDAAFKSGLMDRVTASTKLDEVSMQHAAALAQFDACVAGIKAELVDLVARCKPFVETHNALCEAILSVCYRRHDELIAEIESAAVSEVHPNEHAADSPCDLSSSNEISTGSQSTPPRLQWDGDKKAFTIDGKKVRKFPGTMVAASGYSSTDFERNAWIYRQCMLGIPYNTIRNGIKIESQDWGAIKSRQGVREAANRFAVRIGLPDLPLRKPGRRPRKAD